MFELSLMGKFSVGLSKHKGLMIHSVAFVSGFKSSFFVKSVLNEEQLLTFGQQLGEQCRAGSVIYLQGTLGMGKTTLSRALVQGLGWQGRVKSPTYTLFEEYSLADTQVLHFDLYRLADAEELEFMGIRDLDAESSIWLVEWPDKGAGFLPPADILLTLTEGESEYTRCVSLEGLTARGQAQVAGLNELQETPE